MTQQEKAFVFHTKEDYIVYLHELIAVIFEHMFCLSGVRNCIKSVLKTTNGNIINADIYNALSIRAMHSIRFIANLIGDNSATSMSYLKFRKHFTKNHSKLGITSFEENKKIEKTLQYFNTFRNWSMHYPESLIIKKREIFKLDTLFNEYYKDITITTFQYHEIKYLKQLNKEIKGFHKDATRIIEAMCSDYEAIIGHSVEIKIDKLNVKPYLIMDIVKASHMAQFNYKKNY